MSGLYSGAMREEMPSFSDLVDNLVPIYRAGLSLDEVQTLNKICSSTELRNWQQRQENIHKESYNLVIKEILSAHERTIINLMSRGIDLNQLGGDLEN
jgi:hypothetical protein